MSLYRFRALSEFIERLTAAARLRTTVIGGSAFIALVLSALGVYGVSAYSAEIGKRGLGVRLALGASRLEIVALVLREAAIVASAGVGIGVLLTAGVLKGASSYFVDLGNADPIVLFAAAATLSLVSVLGSLWPAVAASRLSPMSVLRSQ